MVQFPPFSLSKFLPFGYVKEPFNFKGAEILFKYKRGMLDEMGNINQDIDS